MQTAEEFLATGQKFKLGMLDTEKPHPQTVDLSDLAMTDLRSAVEVLANVDCSALSLLSQKAELISELQAAIQQTWFNGGRVFLCGCGATGRLSLTLEVLSQQPDKVLAFMAGGDVALVHSLEGFEDFPEYGERHLRQLGFSENDLLIAATEGGETPFVIGATRAASRISKCKPYFLYCNPSPVLCQFVERSRQVLEDPAIEKIELAVGPMALAGSTRMQASTVLQLAIGYALLTDYTTAKIESSIALLKTYLLENASHFLPAFIERETDEYQAQRYIMYHVHEYAITVFTDTTERAPTFSLTPFSQPKAEKLLKLKPSLSYVCLPMTENREQAWLQLIGRQSRAINWPDIDVRTQSEYLSGFDFSKKAYEFRSWLTSGAEHSAFEIFKHKGSLVWRLQDLESTLLLPEFESVLFEHTLLKMLLNMHSTLVMGRLGRYKRNLMTWVYPTNGKLIDRAARYIQTLLNEDGLEISYESIVRRVFELRAILSANESLVLAVYKSFKT